MGPTKKDSVQKKISELVQASARKFEHPKILFF